MIKGCGWENEAPWQRWGDRWSPLLHISNLHLSSDKHSVRQDIWKAIWTAWGLPGSSAGKEYICNVGALGSIPGLGRSPRGRAWQPAPVFLPGESPWTEDPGGLSSIGSQIVRHDWATKHSTAHEELMWRDGAPQVVPTCKVLHSG